MYNISASNAASFGKYVFFAIGHSKSLLIWIDCQPGKTVDDSDKNVL